MYLPENIEHSPPVLNRYRLYRNIRMKKVLLWFRIIRPGTITASLSPVIIGLAAASSHCRIKIAIAVITFVSASSLQILANLINDYYDFRKGLDKAGRLGPKRALAEGEVTENEMVKAILITAGAAIITGLYLVFIGGIPVLLVGCSGLLFAWLYTATSFSLSYLGIADIIVFIYFGPVSACGTAYLQTGHFLMSSLWPGVITGFISMAVLTVNNIRDIESDSRLKKKSPVVRFGIWFGRIEFLMLYLLAIPCLMTAETGILPYAIVPAGVALFIFVLCSKGREFNRLLILTGLSNLLFAVLYVLDRIIWIHAFFAKIGFLSAWSCR